MNELVKLVAQKVGIPEPQAQIAVETVIGFLKQRLPAPIAEQIDGLLQNPDLAKKAGDAAKGLEGLLKQK